MRRWRPEEEVLDAAVSTTARLTYALDRLIAVQTLETARTVICQCAAELANADQVLLFELEDENRPGSLELTSTIGDECGARDAQTAARLLSVEAASSGLAHSTLDRFDEPDLDRLAISWHAAGRLCLSYPLRQRESCVG